MFGNVDEFFKHFNNQLKESQKHYDKSIKSIIDAQK